MLACSYLLATNTLKGESWNLLCIGMCASFAVSFTRGSGPFVPSVFEPAYHFLLWPVAHWFDKNVICIKVDGHHYVPVASLGREGECSGLVGVDGVGEVVDVEESLLGHGDGRRGER